MARGINKVILVGNIGQEPETRTFPDGGSITNISIATSESWKDKQTGQQQERTEWHRVVFRNRLAEIAAQYLHKGSKVYVEGSLRTRKWQDKQGVDKYTTEIMASEMQMLDSKGDASQQNYQQQAPQQNYQQQAPQQQSPQQNYQQQAPQQNHQQQAPQGQPQGQQPAPAPTGFDDFDDDIPF